MNQVVMVNFAKVNPNATIPTKRDEDAGYDLYPCFEDDSFLIPAHSTGIIPTGIASAFPEGYYFKVEERSSTGSKGIKISSGIIDSGYRGEWGIVIYNASGHDLYIVKKDQVDQYHSMLREREKSFIIYPYEKAIAQAIFHKIPDHEVKELSYEELRAIPSERGTGKLGSTNK